MKIIENLKTKLHLLLNNIWYQDYRPWGIRCLKLLSYFYRIGEIFTRWCVKKYTYHGKTPVIVVGNLTTGGNGKTPAIIALVKLLHTRGLKVGVISRGYPINPKHPILLHENIKTTEVGDEAFLIYQSTHVPMCVCKDRRLALQELELLHLDCILSDDGLQNYSFHHDGEIVLVDKIRQFGNKQLLPAGPLREPLDRLKRVDFIVEKCLVYRPEDKSTLSFELTPYQLILRPQGFISLDGKKTVQGNFFNGKKVLAITAIANPQGFFNTLRALGVSFEKRSLPDHAPIGLNHFIGYEDYHIIMTEKDAVKAREIYTASRADAPLSIWYLALEGNFSHNFDQAFNLFLEKILLHFRSQ